MSTISKQIKHGMAMAFFAMAYVDQWENSENGSNILNPCGCDWMDLVPDEIDKAASEAAENLATELIEANCRMYADTVITHERGLRLIYEHVEALQESNELNSYDRELSPELFGHYLAMQAMGTGVGLESFGNAVRDAITVPYMEFSYFDLEKDYFGEYKQDE